MLPLYFHGACWAPRPFLAQLSLIQTDWPACSHAIWWPNLALAGWPPPPSPDRSSLEVD